MQVQVEHLANLRVINFYIPSLVKNNALLFCQQSRDNPEFLNNIFSSCNVEHCLLTPDLFACKYAKEADVEEMRLLIMAELEDFVESAQEVNFISDENEVMELAQAVADSYVRPTLNRDKGDIELLDFADGTLRLRFTGHCAGCPFAQNTLNNVIAKAFNRLVPAIKEIRLEE